MNVPHKYLTIHESTAAPRSDSRIAPFAPGACHGVFPVLWAHSAADRHLSSAPASKHGTAQARLYR